MKNIGFFNQTPCLNDFYHRYPEDIKKLPGVWILIPYGHINSVNKINSRWQKYQPQRC
ncbi:hypothetical protein SMM_0079 [Spiroplasma mirum ATCC 29335]|nr:hypothetical protein SMM_0079 [Spiroplasma mirum ATCC 29335]